MKTLFLTTLLLVGFSAEAAKLSSAKLSILKVWVSVAGKETSLNNIQVYKNRLSSIEAIASKKSKHSRGKKMIAIHALIQELEKSAQKQFQYLPDALGYNDVHEGLQNLSADNKAGKFEIVESKAKNMLAELNNAESDIQGDLL